MAWYDVPAGQKDSTATDWYEQRVLDFVRQTMPDKQVGRATFGFSDVKSAAGGHTGNFRVFSDALKIDGVRISCSATLAQQIADLLGCCLLTPRLADLAFAQRAIDVKPHPIPISSTTGAMVKESQLLDSAIGGRAGLAQSVGKHWVLTNTLIGKKASGGQAACNFGWQFAGDSFGGQRWGSAVTPGLRCIQDMGWAHDIHHADYSQTCVLVSRDCTVDGQPRDLRDVLQDPQLSALVSHEGPLRIVRQPGVSELEPIRGARKQPDGGLVAMNGDDKVDRWLVEAKRVALPHSATIVGIAIGLSFGGIVGGILGLAVGAAIDTIRRT